MLSRNCLKNVFFFPRHKDMNKISPIKTSTIFPLPIKTWIIFPLPIKCLFHKLCEQCFPLPTKSVNHDFLPPQKVWITISGPHQRCEYPLHHWSVLSDHHTNQSLMNSWFLVNVSKISIAPSGRFWSQIFAEFKFWQSNEK